MSSATLEFAANAGSAAVYVFKGFYAYTGGENWPNTIANAREGELGIVCDIAALGLMLEKLYCELDRDGQCAGVWEYEVAEPLGVWLAQQDDWPTPDEVESKARELALDGPFKPLLENERETS